MTWSLHRNSTIQLIGQFLGHREVQEGLVRHDSVSILSELGWNFVWLPNYDISGKLIGYFNFGMVPQTVRTLSSISWFSATKISLSECSITYLTAS